MSDPLAHIADPTLERLSAFLDGDLDPADRAEVERELSAAPELQAALAAMRRSQGMIRQHGSARAPADFAERVLAAVDREPVPISRARGWRRPMGVPVEIWALAAAALLVLAVGLKAKTMSFGGTPDIIDDSPSPATMAPQTKEDQKAEAKPAPVKSKPVQSMAPSSRQGTVDLNTATDNTAGSADRYPTANPEEVSSGSFTTAPQGTNNLGNLPGTAGTRVVGETTGWKYVIKASEDVKGKLDLIARKHGGTVTNAQELGNAGDTLLIDVPSREIAAFNADLQKLGLLEQHPDTSQLQLGDNVKVMIAIEPPDKPTPTDPK
jgi:negative regulator of sigma E activity